MHDTTYIGLDVHQATTSVAVLDSAGKLVMEAVLETKAETILQFMHGLRGSLQVTFEEGTCAAWLHGLAGGQTFAHEVFRVPCPRFLGAGFLRFSCVCLPRRSVGLRLLGLQWRRSSHFDRA